MFLYFCSKELKVCLFSMYVHKSFMLSFKKKQPKFIGGSGFTCFCQKVYASEVGAPPQWVGAPPPPPQREILDPPLEITSNFVYFRVLYFGEVRNIWIYSILEWMTKIQRILFVVAASFLPVGGYFIEEAVTYLACGKLIYNIFVPMHKKLH